MGSEAKYQRHKKRDERRAVQKSEYNSRTVREVGRSAGIHQQCVDVRKSATLPLMASLATSDNQC